MDYKLFDLGLVAYSRAWDFQKDIFRQVKDKKLIYALILCEHPPTITLGRSSKIENILVNQERLKQLGIEVYHVERGGDVTYHGPGQLCVYPIVNLSYFKRDINWYLRSLEALLLDTLSDFTIKARRHPGLTGIWVRQNKIASIGISIKNWISFHGMSLNIKKDDIANFSLIRPCGMDIIMSSMEHFLKKEVGLNQVKKALIRRWYETSNFTRIRRRH